ncbi:zinc finger BED domain-containing protein RICESLEEPER 2-like [Asparagus officinalis]|uniref:zinc finger BED domain-containing protein RICESLEEPER 2-like n=1 Tax=Asparagus officinalis TaxID=4686 RepID=UPI00098E5003|nr:zinc finger BED domain-containing protein RICESLEEPER 2-like [Asparagus officinalis]
MSLNDQFSIHDDGSDDESTSKRKRRQTSKVWDHFTKLSTDNDEKTKVQCNMCNHIYVGGHGTKTMLRHMDSCPKRNLDEADSSRKSMPLNQEKYREMLARVIALHGYPFTFVEHRGNRELHSFLNSEVKHISRNTAKTDLIKLYKKEKGNLKQALKLVPSRICLTTDLWTSSTSDYYMSLTAHYVDDCWILQNKILALSHVSPPYSGAILVEKLFHLLKDWGIEKRIFTVTLDNASYNDVFMRILKYHPVLEDHFVSNGDFLHVRCCAHILNIVVQDGLKVIDKSLSKIRECIKYVKSPPGRKKKFAECIYFGGVFKIQKCIMEEMKSDDQDIRSMANDMKIKFDKYWEYYSVILSFAVILDPRYKVKYVEFCFEKLGVSSDYVLTILEKLRKLYKEYERASLDTSVAESSGEENFGDVPNEW